MEVATLPMLAFAYETSAIRVVMIDDDPWWVASDIAALLGYDKPANMLRMLRPRQKGAHIVSTLGGSQSMSVISEGGLFKCIMRSRKPEAEAFEDWVTDELLPTLRRTGRYEIKSDSSARVLDLEGALGTADDRHAIKTALLTINTYKDLYGLQAGREMLERLGFPVPGVTLSPASVGGEERRASGEGDLHAWSRAAGLKPSRRDATHLSELYEKYTAWCGAQGNWVMHPKKFRDAMVMLFNHEEHPEMIRVVVTR